MKKQPFRLSESCTRIEEMNMHMPVLHEKSGKENAVVDIKHVLHQNRGDEKAGGGGNGVQFLRFNQSYTKESSVFKVAKHVL